jgi:L-ascorbate metabolism protein UlaG (beta-lactamase superfamily)
MADGAAAAPRAGASGDRIQFLGHASVLIELEGRRLLTDPVLRGRVAHLRRKPPEVDMGATADLAAVLISHLHRDHLDLASLRLLGRDVPLLVPVGAGAWLRRRGFTAVTELHAGDLTTVGPVTVSAVRADHGARRGPLGPRAEPLGYVVRGRRAVYFAGDTARFSEMSALGGSLDVALLPVGGWGPTLGPGHMDPLDAARAVAQLSPRLAIPIHWGTLFPVNIIRAQRERMGDPAHAFAEQVATLAPGVEVRVLRPGQQTLL